MTSFDKVTILKHR